MTPIMDWIRLPRFSPFVGQIIYAARIGRLSKSSSQLILAAHDPDLRVFLLRPCAGCKRLEWVYMSGWELTTAKMCYEQKEDENAALFYAIT